MAVSCTNKGKKFSFTYFFINVCHLMYATGFVPSLLLWNIIVNFRWSYDVAATLGLPNCKSVFVSSFHIQPTTHVLFRGFFLAFLPPYSFFLTFLSHVFEMSAIFTEIISVSIKVEKLLFTGILLENLYEGRSTVINRLIYSDSRYFGLLLGIWGRVGVSKKVDRRENFFS